MKSKYLNKPPKEICKIISTIFLCLSAFVAFTGPMLAPVFPKVGVDPSWMFSINYAVAHGLAFGKDIIFTYGPYGTLWTTQYYPTTDHLMVGMSFFLGFNYALLCFLLSKGTCVYWQLMYGLLISNFVFLRDSLFISYPLLLALLIYRITLPQNHPRAIHIANTLTTFVLTSLFFALGLLPLIKGTFLLIAAATAFLICIVLYYTGFYFWACCSIIVPIISCIVCWLLVGQPIAVLPDFFSNIFYIISGYASGMGVDHLKIGNAYIEIILYIAAIIHVPVVLLKDKNVQNISRAFVLISYAAFLFVVFKSSFIRMEHTHELIAATSLMMAAISVNFIVTHRQFNFWIVVFGLPFFLYTTGIFYIYKYAYAQIHQENPLTNPGVIERNSFDLALSGLEMRFSPGTLQRRFDDSLKDIQNSFSIPSLKGTTDIYSYNQAYLLASKNIWEPRPVLQSYSAYLPHLLLLDQAYLLGNQAPDNILFKVEPIDDRFPALEDGLSWQVFINNYRVTQFDHDYAFLRKKDIIPKPLTSVTTYNSIHKLGEKIPLSMADTPLFAEIDIEPTFWGKISFLLLKPPELYISITLTNGQEKDFRVISDMMKTQFLLSPLVEDTHDFISFMEMDKEWIENKRVRSIVLKAPGDKNGIFWSQTFIIQLGSFHRLQEPQ